MYSGDILHYCAPTVGLLQFELVLRETYFWSWIEKWMNPESDLVEEARMGREPLINSVYQEAFGVTE